MTPEQFKRKLEDKIADLNTAKLIYPVAAKVQDKIVDRLFERGEGAQGKLGAYDTTSAYYTKKQFKNKGAFRAQGKNAKGDFKNGNKRKSMFLPQGYKELKQVQGYESGFVNLQYSKDLRNDFSTGLVIKGDKVLAVVKRKINADKVDGLSNKYGAKTFHLTEDEKEFFRKETGKKLVEYFNA